MDGGIPPWVYQAYPRFSWPLLAHRGQICPSLGLSGNILGLVCLQAETRTNLQNGRNAATLKQMRKNKTENDEIYFFNHRWAHAFFKGGEDLKF